MLSLIGIKECIYYRYFLQKYFHLSALQQILTNNVYNKNKFENPYSEMLEKKKKISPLITLIDTNKKATVISLENANKLALQQNLKLQKVEDISKVIKGRLTFQMITGKEHFENVMKMKSEKIQTPKNKGSKFMPINTKIDTADFEVKVKKMIELLDKGFKVKIQLNLVDANAADKFDEIFSAIENALKEKGTISSKQNSGKGIKFLVSPINSNEES